MVVFLLGLVIVIGSLAAAVWRVRWLRGTLRTKAEVLSIRSHEEEGGGQYNMMETVNELMYWFAGLLCAALGSAFLFAGLQMLRE